MPWSKQDSWLLVGDVAGGTYGQKNTHLDSQQRVLRVGYLFGRSRLVLAPEFESEMEMDKYLLCQEGRIALAASLDQAAR